MEDSYHELTMPVFHLSGKFAHILSIKFRSVGKSRAALFLTYLDNFVMKVFEISGLVSGS